MDAVAGFVVELAGMVNSALAYDSRTRARPVERDETGLLLPMRYAGSVRGMIWLD